MSRKSVVWVAVVVLIAVVRSACGGSSGGGDAAGVPTDVALKVTGAVTNEIGWTEDAAGDG